MTIAQATHDLQVRSVVLKRCQDMAVIEIDNPPVNAMSAHVRDQLITALNEAEKDPSVAGIVLMGVDNHFVAGADIREFGKAPIPPTLPDVVEALDRCVKPIVAAIAGKALGGGLELALACDGRIAKPNAILGFPEVKLGLIPGAGGTQRLPRLTGIAKAIELIASGKNIKASEAERIGLIDEIIEGSLLDAALNRLRELAGRKRRISSFDVPREEQERIHATSALFLTGKRNVTDAIRTAVNIVTNANSLDFIEGLKAERAAFLRLKDGDEASALRYLFFAEREASKVPDLNAVPSPVRTIGVVGGGTMGSGIAVALINAGLSVVLVERDKQALETGLARIDDILNRSVRSGHLSQEMMRSRRQALVPVIDMDALKNVDLIIEAAFEDLNVKLDLFKELDRIASPNTLLATNTSYLDVNLIAAATSRPRQVLGLHFFSPAHIMKLLEVVRGRATSDTALATGIALGRQLGKLPVIAGVCDGFIGNRIFSAYRRQCEIMLEEGALPEEIDGALESFGLAMGPFAVADLAGLDVSWSRRKRLAATRDPRERYVSIADTLCEQGRFGQKTGAGWYRYPKPGQRDPDPEVRVLIEQASASQSITRRTFTSEEIQRRALAAMVNEAVLVLEDGIAERASDIDVVLVHGYGFPATRGGPLFWAARQDANQLGQALAEVEASTGYGFRRAQDIFESLRKVAGP